MGRKLSENTVTGLTEDGKVFYKMNNNRVVLQEDFSKWGSTGGGRPKEWTEEKLMWAAGVLLEWFLSSPDNIWISDFEKETGIDTEFIFPYYPSVNEEAKSESFTELVKKCRTAQEENILKGAWDKPNRTGIAAFWLKNKRGWADKVEHHNTSDTAPFVLNLALLPGNGKTPIEIQPITPDLIDKAPQGLKEPSDTNETPE